MNLLSKLNPLINLSNLIKKHSRLEFAWINLNKNMKKINYKKNYFRPKSKMYNSVWMILDEHHFQGIEKEILTLFRSQ